MGKPGCPRIVKSEVAHIRCTSEFPVGSECAQCLLRRHQVADLLILDMTFHLGIPAVGVATFPASRMSEGRHFGMRKYDRGNWCAALEQNLKCCHRFHLTHQAPLPFPVLCLSRPKINQDHTISAASQGSGRGHPAHR